MTAEAFLGATQRESLHTPAQAFADEKVRDIVSG